MTIDARCVNQRGEVTCDARIVVILPPARWRHARIPDYDPSQVLEEATTVSVDFLAGLRVLELGDGVAGASATGILAALGAEVTAVVDTTQPPSSRESKIDGAAVARLFWHLPRSCQNTDTGGRR